MTKRYNIEKFNNPNQISHYYYRIYSEKLVFEIKIKFLLFIIYPL